jgi:hypothetical protein
VDLITGMQKRQDEARRQAEDRYRELIEKDTCTPAEVQEVEALIKVLRKSLDDVAQDQRVLQSARQQISLIDRARGVDQQRDAAEKAVLKYREEMLRLQRQQQEGLSKLIYAQQDLESKLEQGRAARRELAELRRTHPALLERCVTSDV